MLTIMIAPATYNATRQSKNDTLHVSAFSKIFVPDQQLEKLMEDGLYKPFNESTYKAYIKHTASDDVYSWLERDLMHNRFEHDKTGTRYVLLVAKKIQGQGKGCAFIDPMAMNHAIDLITAEQDTIVLFFEGHGEHSDTMITDRSRSALWQGDMTIDDEINICFQLTRRRQPTAKLKIILGHCYSAAGNIQNNLALILHNRLVQTDIPHTIYSSPMLYYATSQSSDATPIQSGLRVKYCHTLENFQNALQIMIDPAQIMHDERIFSYCTGALLKFTYSSDCSSALNKHRRRYVELIRYTGTGRAQQKTEVICADSYFSLKLFIVHWNEWIRICTSAIFPNLLLGCMIIEEVLPKVFQYCAKILAGNMNSFEMHEFFDSLKITPNAIPIQYHGIWKQFTESIRTAFMSMLRSGTLNAFSQKPMFQAMTPQDFAPVGQNPHEIHDLSLGDENVISRVRFSSKKECWKCEFCNHFTPKSTASCERCGRYTATSDFV